VVDRIQISFIMGDIFWRRGLHAFTANIRIKHFPEAAISFLEFLGLQSIDFFASLVIVVFGQLTRIIDMPVANWLETIGVTLHVIGDLMKTIKIPSNLKPITTRKPTIGCATQLKFITFDDRRF